MHPDPPENSEPLSELAFYVMFHRSYNLVAPVGFEPTMVLSHVRLRAGSCRPAKGTEQFAFVVRLEGFEPTLVLFTRLIKSQDRSAIYGNKRKRISSSIFCAPGGTRTPDHVVKSHLLPPAELRAHYVMPRNLSEAIKVCIYVFVSFRFLLLQLVVAGLGIEPIW